MSYRPPQDVYARHLLSSRGYPLWIPEPDRQLLEYERTEGLEIGDVGVVDPEDGCFDVLFNIRLSANHPFHRAFGVPKGFKHVELRDGDIRITPNIETPGCITSVSVMNVEPSRSTQSESALDYEFSLHPKEGALLVLPEGAERHVLRNETCFLDYAIRYGADWYRFVQEHRGWIINRDSLYLITGLYKTRSWSLAAYENATEASGFYAQFRATQVGSDDVDIGTDYTWRTARPLNRRVGPVGNYGRLNQAVFIRGFKIALRSGFPGMTRVMVKADAPSTRPIYAKSSCLVPGNTWVTNFWDQKRSGGTAGAGEDKDDAGSPSIEQASSIATDEMQDVSVEIQRLPEVSKVFHPCDILNQYLLQQEPSANIAITHDSDWITLLENELLTPGEIVQEERLKNVVSQMYRLVSRKGAVFLESKRSSDTQNKYLSVANVHGSTLNPEGLDEINRALERATLLLENGGEEGNKLLSSIRGQVASLDAHLADPKPLPTNYGRLPRKSGKRLPKSIPRARIDQTSLAEENKESLQTEQEVPSNKVSKQLSGDTSPEPPPTVDRVPLSFSHKLSPRHDVVQEPSSKVNEADLKPPPHSRRGRLPKKTAEEALWGTPYRSIDPTWRTKEGGEGLRDLPVEQGKKYNQPQKATLLQTKDIPHSIADQKVVQNDERPVPRPVSQASLPKKLGEQMLGDVPHPSINLTPATKNEEGLEALLVEQDKKDKHLYKDNLRVNTGVVPQKKESESDVKHPSANLYRLPGEKHEKVEDTLRSDIVQGWPWSRDSPKLPPTRQGTLPRKKDEQVPENFKKDSKSLPPYTPPYNASHQNLPPSSQSSPSHNQVSHEATSSHLDSILDLAAREGRYSSKCDPQHSSSPFPLGDEDVMDLFPTWPHVLGAVTSVLNVQHSPRSYDSSTSRSGEGRPHNRLSSSSGSSKTQILPRSSTHLDIAHSTNRPVINTSKQTVTGELTADPSHPREKRDASLLCPVPGCGHAFATSFDLKAHTYTAHDKEHQFQCSWPGCGKRFTQRHYCEHHEQLHLNSRAFTCELCNRAFVSMDSLNKHLRFSPAHRDTAKDSGKLPISEMKE